MKKQLLSQLNKLQDIKPDKQWKTDSQEFLRTHISEGAKSRVFSNVMMWVKDFAKVSSQPAFALAAFVLILITGIAFFNPLLSDAKPNDSLYIARIISEKAQVNMTFNKENRDKLSAKFAINHAQDITNLMNNPEFHSQEGSQDKIANLSDNFNKEIDSARASINSINERGANTHNTNYNNRDNRINKNNGSDLGSEDSSTDGSEADDEGIIFSADTKRDNQGLEINVKDKDGDDNNKETVDDLATTETDIATSTEDNTATSTEEARTESADNSEESANIEKENASSTLNQLQSITDEVNEEDGDVNEAINKALDDAQRLYNEARYQEIPEKLIEVEEMLEGVSLNISDEPSVE